MTQSVESFDPLPEVFLTDEVGIGGSLKERPEDFLVEELPLYQPVGEGEHLYLLIEKTGRPTLEVVRELARAFHVRVGAVGYAGMKDKHAITRQLISIHTRDDSPLEELNLNGVKVLWADRHSNKLRLGHLAGNRFVIRIRNVEATDAVPASRMLNRLVQHGAPNFVGEQRFGFYLNNHEVGRRFIRQDWDGVVQILLGGADAAVGGDRSAREAFDRGDLRAAAHAWPRHRAAEYRIAHGLARGMNAEDAIFSTEDATRRFFVSAFQSAVFNHILVERIARWGIHTLTEGDLACKHDNRAVFAVGADELNDPDVIERLRRIAISPSGPMWGHQMIQPAGEPGEMEHAALRATGVTVEDMRTPPIDVRGGRRALRTPVSNAAVEGGLDEHGAYVKLTFDLPRGCFATTVLREIMKTPRREHPWGSSESRADEQDES